MARMDWIPMAGWGIPFTVPALTQDELSLLEPDQYEADAVIGRVEDSPLRMFIHRIVGQISAHYNSAPVTNNLMTTRLWPGLADTSTVPFTTRTPGFLDESKAANPRLWFDRRRSLDTREFEDLTETAHPFWSTIDIAPKQVIEDGRIPVLSIFNHDTQASLDYQPWLRMLVTPLG